MDAIGRREPFLCRARSMARSRWFTTPAFRMASMIGIMLAACWSVAALRTVAEAIRLIDLRAAQHDASRQLRIVAYNVRCAHEPIRRAIGARQEGRAADIRPISVERQLLWALFLASGGTLLGARYPIAHRHSRAATQLNQHIVARLYFGTASFRPVASFTNATAKPAWCDFDGSRTLLFGASQLQN
jgi:hypothetical protein